MARRDRQALGRTPQPGAGVGELIPPVGDAPARFGTGAHNYFVRTFLLDTARTLVEIPMTGTFIYISAATNQDTNVDIRLNTQREAGANYRLGRLVGGFPFDKIYLSHAAQAGETITLEYGVTHPDLPLNILNPSNVISTVELRKYGTITNFIEVAVPAATLAVIRAANGNRREIGLTNTGVNWANVGGTGVGGFTGIRLYPQQTVFLDTTAAINAFGAAAGATAISGFEIEV